MVNNTLVCHSVMAAGNKGRAKMEEDLCGALIKMYQQKQTDNMGEYWKHMLEMNKDKSISFFFTFRSVATTVEVTEEGYLAHPEKITHAKKDAKFKKGEQLLKGEEYKKQVQEIDRRVGEFLNNFKS
jgi:hypothetical protein